MCDFNAKSGRLSEFELLDKYVVNADLDNIGHDSTAVKLEALGFSNERFSSDDHCPDKYGRRLVEVCKFTSLYFANGRCGDDCRIGKTTTIYDSTMITFYYRTVFFRKSVNLLLKTLILYYRMYIASLNLAIHVVLMLMLS